MTSVFNGRAARIAVAGLSLLAAAGAAPAVAADYPMTAAPSGPVVVQATGVDGFGLQHYGYTGRGYPIYGYGGYIGPYYRNGCFGEPIDCGPRWNHRYVRHHHVRRAAAK
jgi:hypothetical protein